MGTRAVTNVVDEEGTVYVSLYRQFDGYLMGGHGEELANWLKDAVIGNGIGSNPPPNFFNGVGDLAARLVTYFKEDQARIGRVYIVPAGSGWGADFTYTVTVIENKPVIVSVDDEFKGTVEEFLIWMKEYEEED